MASSFRAMTSRSMRAHSQGSRTRCASLWIRTPCCCQVSYSPQCPCGQLPPTPHTHTQTHHGRLVWSLTLRLLAGSAPYEHTPLSQANSHYTCHAQSHGQAWHHYHKHYKVSYTSTIASRGLVSCKVSLSGQPLCIRPCDGGDNGREPDLPLLGKSKKGSKYKGPEVEPHWSEEQRG